jgi:tRNA A-37 threonylcarbamoyl transferase component Bud32
MKTIKVLPVDSCQFQMTYDRCSYRGVYDRDFCFQTDLQDLLCEITRFLTVKKTLKEGGRTCVSRVSWKAHDLVIKHYLHRSLWQSLRSLFGATRAHQCWTTGRRLVEMDIPTPKPLAYVERCKYGIVWESFLVTQYVPGVNLADHLKALTLEHEGNTVTWLADLLECLSHHCVIHGDLKATNLRVTEEGMWVTDLDGVQFFSIRLRFLSKRTRDHARLLRDLEPNMQVLLKKSLLRRLGS